MTHKNPLLTVLVLTLICATTALAQNSDLATNIVPRLVNYSGKAADSEGKTISGTVGATFAIYSEQSGGSPLWLETQNVQADSRGNFTAQLGATRSEGLPLDLFTSGEARWLGVRINGGEEQPRVLLLSVPYALKAADAQTLGGLPASAFMLATPAATAANSTSIVALPASLTPAVSGTGTTDYVPLWTNGTGALGNSVMFQSGTGSTAKVGLNTTSPVALLDINGTANVRGVLTLPATGAASTTTGRNSQALKLTASSYNTGTGAPVNQNFLWQAEPLSNDTANASGTLNMLHAVGSNPPSETGLKIAGNGQITFAAGQKFPGAGTVSSVALTAPTSDFTVSGSPVLGSGTLAVKWSVAPTSAATANAIVKRDSTGSFSAGAITSSRGVNSSVSGGAAISGYTSFGNGLYGSSTGTGSGNNGVYGITTASAGSGVVGINNNGGLGVYGQGFTGLYGVTDAQSGYGVAGVNNDDGYGVYGQGFSGIYGIGAYGVYGVSNSNNAAGVRGDASDTSNGAGVWAHGSSTGDSLFADNTGGGYAGEFSGDVDVTGNLSKAGGSFKIDHPLDPANKYLYHSFVESPDMKNIYDGVVTTDARGNAVVTLPDWFEALNRDFRYQLTVVGQFAQAIVSAEVSNHQFQIKTDKPNVKVSWQVTGIRQDAWANAHRIPVEQQKAEQDRGLYLHPELFGAPRNKSIAAAHHPMILNPQNAKAHSSMTKTKQ
jgi:trimeric autotransporter adhesin